MRYCRAMSGRTHPRTTAGYRPEFVADVLDDALAHASRVFGIAGLQGCGKSTLAAQMAALAKERGLSVAVLSIDDFYLGRRERLRLGRNAHPLLATRGPPGTHDIDLACATLDALRAGRSTALPRFDKLADRRLPPSRWQRVTERADLIVFEGWFLKVPPENPAALHKPLNTLERDADPQGIWRAYCNLALAAYASLWRRIDRLLFLQGPGFAIVPDWRWQQEVALQAVHPGREAMRRETVERFVLFFERVSRHALRTLPAIADRTIRIDAVRQAAG
jgi:D-glycerate 3-kinase